jgi:hypothetical protein
MMNYDDIALNLLRRDLREQQRIERRIEAAKRDGVGPRASVPGHAETLETAAATPARWRATNFEVR